MSNLVIGDYTAAITIDGSTHYLLVQPGNSSTAYRKINRNVFLGVTGQPADISTAQNITNKTLDNTNTITLKDTLFALQDNSDTTKQAKFELSGITTATTRTYTLPNASSTLADISTAQTFTNKTLTSPTITGGTIDNSTITVDAIAGHTVSGNGTIYGLSIHSGVLQTSNSVVNNTIATAAATTAKVKLDSINYVFNSGSTSDQTNTSTTYTDVTGSSMSYTAPSGNGVLLYLFADFQMTTSSNACYTSFNVNGSIVGKAAYTELSSAITLHCTAVASVAAGATVTVKLQTRQSASGTGTIQSANNRAAELQPRITGFAISA